MKELSIEEKAKRYDEAIVKLRGMMPNWERLSYNGKTFLQDLIHILPELAESEDEKIRRAIRICIDSVFANSDTVYEVNKEQILAWLEKQDESNLIKEIKRRKELLLRENQKAVTPEESLSLGGRIAMLEELLAFTKEKQGEQKPQRMISAEAKEAMYDKPAWSEEDETVLNNLIYALANDRIGNDRDEYISYLKSLKDRNTWKPSDVQIKVCKKVYADVLSAKGFDLGFINNELNRLEDELKKLKG